MNTHENLKLQTQKLKKKRITEIEMNQMIHIRAELCCNRYFVI